MLGQKLGKYGIASSVVLVLLLTGCTGGGGNNNGNDGDDGDNGGTSSTPTPTPTSTPTTPPPLNGEDGEHSHDEISEEQETKGAAYAESFVTTLINKDLSTEAWRAAVIPNLYSDELKELYSTLDPYAIPFCTAVGEVEVGAINTFSVVYKVQFVDTNSFMAIEIEDVSANYDGSAYQVVKMDTKMKDDGGC